MHPIEVCPLLRPERQRHRDRDPARIDRAELRSGERGRPAIAAEEGGRELDVPAQDPPARLEQTDVASGPGRRQRSNVCDDVTRGRRVDMRERAADDRGIAEAEECEVEAIRGRVTARAGLGECVTSEHGVARAEPILGLDRAIPTRGEHQEEKKSGS